MVAAANSFFPRTAHPNIHEQSPYYRKYYNFDSCISGAALYVESLR